MHRYIIMISLLLGSLGLPMVTVAEEEATSVIESEYVGAQFGRFNIYGDGDVSDETLEFVLGVQARKLWDTPLFLSVQGQVLHDNFRYYDMNQWGGVLGVGWEYSTDIDLEFTYRLDSYSVSELAPDIDQRFADVQGITRTSAFGLKMTWDTRDDPHFPTQGHLLQWGSELAFEGFGGDHTFSKMDVDAAWYWMPFHQIDWLKDVVLVEHIQVGWMEAFGASDEVPFYERYFIGGNSTVRGHRSRWLSPRRIDDQFVGGTVQLYNNVELRKPIFKTFFKEKLSTAAFFDVGRSYRRFADVGDFGYGAGLGLRYFIDVWEVQGHLRVDYGFNLAVEDDDSSSNLHVAFGMPF